MGLTLLNSTTVTYFWFSELINIGQAPSHKYEKFPEKYSLWFYVDGQPMYLDLIRDNEVSSAISPALFKMSGYVPGDLMTGDNLEVCMSYQNRFRLLLSKFFCPSAKYIITERECKNHKIIDTDRVTYTYM